MCVTYTVGNTGNLGYNDIIHVIPNKKRDFVFYYCLFHVYLACYLFIFCCSFHISTASGTGFCFCRGCCFSQFLHSLRCPPCFQWVTWHSRPQYCTVWHNLKGCNGRNGVLGLPQVEQLVSRMLLPTYYPVLLPVGPPRKTQPCSLPSIVVFKLNYRMVE